MRLEIYHPHVANRDCQRCLKYIYDEDTGEETKGRDGQPEERFFACWAPCRDKHNKPLKDSPCPKGTAENQLSLTDANRQCYEHYQECRAIGEFPDDPIVRRNARLIRAIEDDRERHDRNAFLTTIAGLIARSGT